MEYTLYARWAGSACGKIKTPPQAALLTKKIVGQVEGSFDVTLNVVVVVDVGFAERQFAGREKRRTQRPRMLENQYEARLPFCSPRSAVP